MYSSKIVFMLALSKLELKQKLYNIEMCINGKVHNASPGGVGAGLPYPIRLAETKYQTSNLEFGSQQSWDGNRRNF